LHANCRGVDLLACVIVSFHSRWQYCALVSGQVNVVRVLSNLIDL
jgi:hypothetical protein